MKFRKSTSEDNDSIDAAMAPMIDVVFQLLIFFMLTLKIIEPEGDFSINMPQGKPAETQNNDVVIEPKIVTMIAKADGTLGQLQFGGQAFTIQPSGNGADISAYIKLNEKEALSRNEASMRIGEDAAFKQMNEAVADWVRKQRQFFSSGNNQADKEKFEKELKIKVKFSYTLHNRYIIKATSACRGQIVPGSKNPRDLVKNIEFIRPAAPPAS
jgi:biopolymer transport protein ExbD